MAVLGLSMGKKKYSRKYKRRTRKNVKGYIKRIARPARELVFPYRNTFPDTYLTKLRYNDQFVTDTLLPDASFFKLYRGGSPYDPEGSVALGQSSAAYHNVLNKVYRKYRTIGCKIEFNVSGNSSSARNDDGQCLIYAYQSNQAIDFSLLSVENVAQYPNTISKYFDSNSRVGYLKKYMSTNRLFGVPKSALRVDEGFSSLVDGNPSKGILYSLGVQNLSSESQTYRGQVKMVFYVEYYDRLQTSAAFTTVPENNTTTGSVETGEA